MADIINAFPSFFLNYKNDTDQIKELCAGKTDGTVIGKFLEHYSELYDMTGNALAADNNPAVGDKVSAIVDKYNCLLDDFQLIEDEKYSDVSYIISGIKTSLQSDFETEILTISDTDACFGDAYTEYVQKNAGALAVGGKMKLKNAIQRLNAVSLYMTGTCAEYEKLLEDAAVIETLNADKNGYMNACEKLYQSAQAYIDSRKPVPSGETGKDRLSIAKELRDICRGLARNLSLDIASELNADTLKPVKERLSEKLQKAVDDLKEAWETNNGLVLRDSISKIVYLDGVEKKAGELDDEKLEDMISNARIRISIKQINKLTTIVAAKFDFLGFSTAAEDGSLKKYVITNFNKFAVKAAAELKTAGA